MVVPHAQAGQWLVTGSNQPILGGHDLMLHRPDQGVQTRKITQPRMSAIYTTNQHHGQPYLSSSYYHPSSLPPSQEGHFAAARPGSDTSSIYHESETMAKAASQTGRYCSPTAAFATQTSALLDRKRKGSQDEYGQCGMGHKPTPGTRAVPTCASPKLKSAGHRATMPADMRISIPAGADDQWRSWFRTGFALVQQTACRHIAKEWIKLIHPKKQSTHPYNGRLSGTKEWSPEKTKPPYWPEHVKHKEPDHIEKEERIELLVHLLMNTPHRQITSSRAEGREYPAQALLSVLERSDNKATKVKWDVMCNMVAARTQLEKLSREAPRLSIKVPDYAQKNVKAAKMSQDKPKIESPRLTANPEIDRISFHDRTDDEEDFISSQNAVYKPVVTTSLPYRPYRISPEAPDDMVLGTGSATSFISSPASPWPEDNLCTGISIQANTLHDQHHAVQGLVQYTDLMQLNYAHNLADRSHHQDSDHFHANPPQFPYQWPATTVAHPGVHVPLHAAVTPHASAMSYQAYSQPRHYTQGSYSYNMQ